MNDQDRLRSQLDGRIELGDGGVVPLLDVAEEDPGKRRTIEHELSRRNACNVQHRHNSAHYHRKLDEPVLFKSCCRQRGVGGAKSDRLRLDLFDATT
jgi:hypothetical protein